MTIIGTPEFVEMSLTQQALMEIQGSEYDFHLTGSRFFNTEKKDSDYDFFTQDYLSLADWLRAHDFINITQVMPTSYADPLVIAIYQKGKVHIQVVNDAPLKCCIQDCLRKSPLKAGLGNKGYARDFWRLLVSVAKSQTE